MSRWVVVLAGGVGSRFWPLSTPERPKQFLALVSDQPLLRDALDRVRPLASSAHTLVLTNASLVPAVEAVAPELPRENVIGEPRAGGTAAALAWAAHLIEQREGPAATMLSIHADWAVADPAEFRRVLGQAAEAAEHHAALVTVGVVPSRADTGFGYVQPGAELGNGVRRVARFVEKPDRAHAEEMYATGYLWNSGIFAWRVGEFLDDLRAHTPEVAPALAANPGDVGEFFAQVTPVSVDVGLLERSQRVLVIPGDFGWDDVGVWAALSRVRPRDSHGNAMHGDVHAIDAAGNIVYADGGTVVLFGVRDLVVVTRAGLTLVTPASRSHELKALLEQLPPRVRELR
jgi:mannose-1-phosphate guanylyltransferase